MATKALTGFTPTWFTPTDQRDKDIDRPTRYKLKPLDGIQFLEVAANGDTQADGTFMPNHKGRLLLLRNGIKGWENVVDHDDETLEFNIARIKFIPAPHLVECVNEILERSALGAADEKN